MPLKLSTCVKHVDTQPTFSFGAGKCRMCAFSLTTSFPAYDRSFHWWCHYSVIISEEFRSCFASVTCRHASQHLRKFEVAYLSSRRSFFSYNKHVRVTFYIYQQMLSLFVRFAGCRTGVEQMFSWPNQQPAERILMRTHHLC